MAWESTGRVAVTSGSATVTGTGTVFDTGARVGDGFVGPDGKLYEIANIVSSTSITIAPEYQGTTATNQAYKIVPVRGYSKLAADKLQDVLPAVQQAEGVEDWMVPFDKLGAQEAIGDLEPSAGGIPRADSAGKLDEGWFSEVLVRKDSEGLVPLDELKASIQAAADTLVLTGPGGKIHSSRLDVADIAEKIVATFSQIVQDILSRDTAAQIRKDLGLGSAATKNVGAEAGNVVVVSSSGSDSRDGLIPINSKRLTIDAGELVYDRNRSPGFYGHELGNRPSDAPSNTGASMIVMMTGSSGTHFRQVLYIDRRGVIRVLQYSSDTSDEWETFEQWSSTNTTTDSNGFIKAASPVIKLFDDKIEKTDHLEIQSAAFEKIGTGKYKLTGVPELSRDGWYIETPIDRNKNVYFTLDYEESDGELIIKTYEPDYSSGKAENGAPLDILEGRFISLRFTEDPSLYPDPEEGEEIEDP